MQGFVFKIKKLLQRPGKLATLLYICRFLPQFRKFRGLLTMMNWNNGFQRLLQLCMQIVNHSTFEFAH